MSELHLKVGDYVHYGAHGVCRVCGLESKKFGGKQKMYYILRPTGGENISLFLPEDAEPEKVRLRGTLTPEAMMKLIRQARQESMAWIADSKLRRESFTRILRSGDVLSLMKMIRSIHDHQAELPQGKQLPMSDQEMMTAAKRQLHSEMAFVLHMEEKDLLPCLLGEFTPEVG